jgi:HEAT repeat protein
VPPPAVRSATERALEDPDAYVRRRAVEAVILILR